jgi:hypothetical protein
MVAETRWTAKTLVCTTENHEDKTMYYVWIALVCIMIDMIELLTFFLFIRRKRHFVLKNVYNASTLQSDGSLISGALLPWVLWAVSMFYYHEINNLLSSIAYISLTAIPAEISIAWYASMYAR